MKPSRRSLALASSSLSIGQDVLDRLPAGKPFILEIRNKAPGEKIFGPIIELIIQKEGHYQLLGLKRGYRS